MVNKKNFQKFIPHRPAELDPALGRPRADISESRRLAHDVARRIQKARLEGGVNRSHYDEIIRDRYRLPR